MSNSLKQSSTELSEFIFKKLLKEADDLIATLTIVKDKIQKMSSLVLITPELLEHTSKDDKSISSKVDNKDQPFPENPFRTNSAAFWCFEYYKEPRQVGYEYFMRSKIPSIPQQTIIATKSYVSAQIYKKSGLINFIK